MSGLAPKSPYVLALAERPDGSGAVQPLAAFTSNLAGAAIVNAAGPIRQLVQTDVPTHRRYLVVLGGTPQAPGPVVQVQAP